MMLDSQSCQMGIGNQICARPSFTKHSLKEWPMGFRGLNDANAGLVEPTLDSLDRFVGCQRPAMQPGVRGNSNEGGKDGPAEAYGFGVAETVVPPFARGRILRRETVFSVKRKICVH